jgi:hypothetical protein
MQLLDSVLNDKLEKPYSNPPPKMALKKRPSSRQRSDSQNEAEADNDF